MGATRSSVVAETGCSGDRCCATLLLGLLPFGAAAAAPLIGGLIRIRTPEPGDRKSFLHYTGFIGAQQGRPVRLVREDGSPIGPPM